MLDTNNIVQELVMNVARRIDILVVMLSVVPVGLAWRFI